MSKRSKSRVRGIAIFIVLLALSITAYKVYKQFNQNIVIDTQDADNTFRTTSWMYKAKYVTNPKKNVDSASQIPMLIKEFSKQPVVYQKRNGHMGTFLFKVENNRIPEMEKKLSALVSIPNVEAFTDSSLVATNLDTEKQKLASYQNERSALDAIRLRSDTQNRRMAVLDGLIRDTQENVLRLEAAGSTLVYLQILPASNSKSPVVMLKYAVTWFFIILAALCLATLVVYFGTKLLTFLLALMGVKGFGLGGALSNYSYKSYSNYTGRYGYGGYGSKNRKVKRIYKDKRSTPEEASPESDK
ncbi:MAG TPA: hypothetical protein PL124_01345 [Candidatus Cloacimonadota bacterium]|nr:hypothetical protein [Candidatus Cloacimonadota bacterium]HPS38037.1 hypothetical protein [Candidatus Cloacimonadota bacterium]